MASPLYRLFALLALAGALAPARAALGQAPDSLAGISGRLTQQQRRALVEKLYVHLDQPAYSAGETIWLKVYAVDGTWHRPLALSTVAYVEVLDAANRPVAQASLALHQATGHGSLVLPTQLASGRYRLRAYTRWMQNFDPAFYFQTPLVVVNTFGASGPVASQAAPTYDVQFFPEGGQLVQGLASRVAFKILDNTGRSLAATGTVADARGAVVARFSTLKYGMGSFQLPPVQAGPYTATVQLASGTRLSYRLPAAQPQGYVASLTEENPVTLRLLVQAAGPSLANGPVQLLGHTGQHVFVAATAALSGGKAVFLIKKRSLPEGVAHFTVFTAARQPVAERLYFQPAHRPLALAVQVAQASYGPREQVRLLVKAPVAATASLAVYRLDSLATLASPADIASTLLLGADLRGTVEDPGYYLRDSSATGRAAADNLMLTQGWSRFHWEEVLAGRPPALPYAPEVRGPVVQAQLTTATGMPAAAGVGSFLTIPSRTGRFYYTVSQPGGTVAFEPGTLVGPQRIILQTDPRRDSTLRFVLRSPYSTRYAPAELVPLRLPGAFAPALAERHVQVQVAQAFADTSRLAYQAMPADTTSFFGQPDKRYRLDNYTRFSMMEEVMHEYVQGVVVRKRREGFHFAVYDRPGQTYFQADPLVLLDGLPVFDPNKIMAFDPLKVKQLDILTARYYQGPLAYEGVLSYTTYVGDLAGFPLSPHALVEEYEGVQGQREFYAPRYDTETQRRSRLPDLRNLLYWNPEMRLAAGQPQTLDFYTSDQAGRYLVVVQGLAADGQLGSTSTSLKVKPQL